MNWHGIRRTFGSAHAMTTTVHNTDHADCVCATICQAPHQCRLCVQPVCQPICQAPHQLSSSTHRIVSLKAAAAYVEGHQQDEENVGEEAKVGAWLCDGVT